IIESALRQLESKPTEVEEFVEHFTFLEAISSKIFQLEDEYFTINQLYSVVRHYHLYISEEQIAIYKILLGKFRQLKTTIKLNKTNREAAITKFREKLEANIAGLQVDVSNLKAN
ncbi:Hypothetical predicted protein, partial [Marmota monax]